MPKDDVRMGKKILILAGTYFQIPVIEYARNQGHYVITCDNRPENPGHKLADKYYNVSTTDFEGVLKIARKENIDGILAYGTDPAAPTAALVSEKMNLPGNSFDSVITLSDKGKFRKFLSQKKFPVPEFGVFKCYEDARIFFKYLNKNVYVKPVDSSGSKGITRLIHGEDLENAYNYALSFSRKKEVIIEEEVEIKGPNIHGEAFILNGELVFMLLGDQYFSKVNGCAPISTTVPSLFHQGIMKIIRSQLAEIIKIIGFTTGGLNVEIIRDNNDRLFFMEIGARHGGNYMPELITIATGFNMAAANVNAVMNDLVDTSFRIPVDKYYSQLILHSNRNGILKGYNLNGQFDDNIRFRKEYYNKGDYVHEYKDSRFVTGVLLFEFNDKYACRNFINFIQNNNLMNIENDRHD